MAYSVIKQAKVSPQYLHSNSTSHTWPFSAFAELIDNAYDPDVSAKEIRIDVQTVDSQECLTFLDDGNGMNPEKLHKMLSFGFSEKEAQGKFKSIGCYGNGFKSGSMRLGMDALVITRCLQSTSIGFLSQTYLKETRQETVTVPMVTWQLTKEKRIKKNTPENELSLKAILQYSLIKTEEKINAELDALETFSTGTKIIIYNLKSDNCGILELDFKSNLTDIRYPETVTLDTAATNRPVETAVPEFRRSLRKYCSILYMKPRLKIYIRGQKVKSEWMEASLLQCELDVYKPKESKQRTGTRIHFGFTTDKTPDAYGMMLYHNNRLIKAFEKVGCQNKVNREGIGVVGVAEVNDLQPIHNKQDFERTKEYISFMSAAAKKLNDYYYEKTKDGEAATLNPGQRCLWAQCDQCRSWRRLPKGYKDDLPDEWYCRDNPDPNYNHCEIPEELELDDEEEIKPSYKKTYKKKQAEEKKQKKSEEPGYNSLLDKHQQLLLQVRSEDGNGAMSTPKSAERIEQQKIKLQTEAQKRKLLDDPAIKSPAKIPKESNETLNRSSDQKESFQTKLFFKEIEEHKKTKLSLENLKKEFDKKSTALRETTTSLEKLKLERLQENKQLEVTKQKLDSLNKELEKKSAENKETNSLLDKLKKQRLEERKQLEETKSALESLKSEQENERIKFNRLLKEKTDKNHDLEQMQNELSVERHKHSETLHTLEMMKNVKSMEKKQIDETNKALERFKTKLSNEIEEHKKTKQILEIQTLARSKEQKELHATKLALEKSRKELDTKSNALRETTISLEKLKQARLEENKHLEETKQEIDNLKKELDKTDAENKETNTLLDEQKKHIVETKNALESLKTKLLNEIEEHKKTKQALNIQTLARSKEQKQLNATKQELEQSKQELAKKITEHTKTNISVEKEQIRNTRSSINESLNAENREHTGNMEEILNDENVELENTDDTSKKNCVCM